MALLFGLISMAGSYAGGRLAASLSDTFQLLFFAMVMLAVAASMFRVAKTEPEPAVISLFAVAGAAAVVGLLTGIVGVGGGFLIVPALVLFAGIPIARAIGTSLVVIAMNCAAGFAAYAPAVELDWVYTAFFTLFAVSGVLAGSSLGRNVQPKVLRRAFAVFLVVVAILVLLQTSLSRLH